MEVAEIWRVYRIYFFLKIFWFGKKSMVIRQYRCICCRLRRAAAEMPPYGRVQGDTLAADRSGNADRAVGSEAEGKVGKRGNRAYMGPSPKGGPVALKTITRPSYM